MGNSKTKTKTTRTHRIPYLYGITGLSLVAYLSLSEPVATVSEPVATVSEPVATVSEPVATVSEPVATVEPVAVDLESNTKDELLAIASESGIQVYKSWTKAKIIAKLSESLI